MPNLIDTHDLHAKLDELGTRIEAMKQRSTAVSGVPFADSTWEKLVDEHRALEEKIRSERLEHSAFKSAHADFDALSLAFESFLRSIDQHFARQRK